MTGRERERCLRVNNAELGGGGLELSPEQPNEDSELKGNDPAPYPFPCHFSIHCVAGDEVFLAFEHPVRVECGMPEPSLGAYELPTTNLDRFKSDRSMS